VERIVEGFDPKSIPDKPQCVQLTVPQRIAEHAAKLGDPSFTVLFIEVDQHLCIAVGSKLMALLDKPVPEFSVIVNFTVQGCPDGAGLISDRLVSPWRVDDLQAANTESDAWLDMPPFVIRTAVDEPRQHLIQKVWIILAEKPANSAHSGPLVGSSW
jgi:hypothetical protein